MMLSAFLSYHSTQKRIPNCSMVPWQSSLTTERVRAADSMPVAKPFKPATNCCGLSYTLKVGACATDVVSKLPISCTETLGSFL